MTDDKLDQILKQALAPEVNESEVKLKVRARSVSMKRIIRISITAVACAAIALVGTMFAGQVGNGDQKATGNKQVAFQNPFVIKAHASTLKKGKAIYIKDSVNPTRALWHFGENDKKQAGYIIDFPLSCEGEGIDTITYKVNKGAFEIYELKGNHIIVDQVPCANTNVLGIGQSDDGAGHELEKAKYCSSFTVKYEKQSQPSTYINLCGSAKLSDQDRKYFFEEDMNKQTVQGKADCMEKMLQGMEITCIVKFKNGTTQEKHISVGVEVKTFAQAGLTCDNPNQESDFMKFEMK